jgi:hypothetical protein
VAFNIDGLPGRDGIEATLAKVRDDTKARLDEEHGWEDVDLDPVVYGSTRLQCKQEGELLVYKCVGDIAGASPKDLVELFWNKDLAARQVWDNSLVEYKLVEAVNEKVEVLFSSYSAGVPLVANRTFVVARTYWEQADGSIVYLGTSVNHDGGLQKPDDVRGTSTVYFEWSKTADGTRVRQFLAADARGSLPAFVINSVKTKTAQQMAAIRTVFSK